MLYFLPVPIGNTQDVTIRVMDLFKEIQFFICEDTRNIKKLFNIYNINYNDKQFFSLTSFTSQSKINHYINILKVNDVGFVSDAGTPGLSDPGKTLVQVCNQNNILYSVLPGANAIIPAVVASGFDTSKFIFVGFLPKKKGRQTIIKKIINDYCDFGLSVFFYESVHRVEKTLSEFISFGFSGKVSIAREISKMHEQFVTGDIETIITMFQSKQIVSKGEFVVGLYRS